MVATLAPPVCRPPFSPLFLQALRPLSTTTRVSVASAGRTDKGVSAFGQVCSFYSWDNIPHAAITAAANAAVPGSLRIHDVQRVPRRFHATFSASWRHYVYLLPLRGGSGGCSSSSAAGAPQAPDYDDDDQQQKQHPAAADGSTTAAVSAGAALPGSAAATGDSGTGDGAPSFDHPLGTDYTVVDVSEVDVGHMDAMLRAISGRSLNFSAFARDTPPGKECTCVIHAARATRVTLPAAAATAAADSSGGAATDVVCIQLVANRFLRKMVRVLVGTLARESIAAAARYPGQADALVRLCEDGSRGATAVSAPPTGLCFVAAGYEDEAPRL